MPPSLPWVFAIDDPLPPNVDPPRLLGGKGAGLVEMRQKLGLPVPPAFIITTEVCRAYLSSGWPAELDALIDEHLDRLATLTGRRFGDESAPLLVSVRSGAPVSMPGMMDTVLNVGITPAARDHLAAESGDALFAADTWLRFMRMYAEIVLAMPRGEVGSASESDGTAIGKAAAAERVQRSAADFSRSGIPLDPRAQLRGAIEAVFRSWNSERARVFRARENLDEALGTAVTVQAMVFGNLDDRSGTGVLFTRDPATGENVLFGDYLPRAQGEDVVAGTHAVSGLATLRTQLPEAHAQLVDCANRLERHYRDVCDVEFTVAAGSLYILQTRVARRSPVAAVRIAIAMAEDPEFPLSRAEAVARVDPETLQRISNTARIDPAATPIAVGRPASPGVGCGVLSCDPDEAAALAQAGTAVILAREDTSPADVHGMVGAAGVVTATGGVASHAAVVARGWGIPCATGVQDLRVEASRIRVGGTIVDCGETVTIDGDTGSLYRGDCRADAPAAAEEARTIRTWAAELGVEPGTAAASATDAKPQRDVSLLEVARTIQLKGLCTPERAAAALGVSPESVSTHLAGAPTLFRETPRGLMLTPEGRQWVEEALERERAACDAELMTAHYTRFTALNTRFKELVHHWQEASAAGDLASLSALLDTLESLHIEFAPVLAAVGEAAPRLAPYSARFEAALAALRAGDHSMLASPLKDSYHTVWFEYHEELIALCNRDRLADERAET